MATQCDVELGKVAVCVSSDAACTCITSPEDFQEQVTQGARQAVAFYNPGTPEYCDGANDNICDYISTSASCCCNKEVESYAQCFFNKEIANFGATDCPYVGGCTSSDDGGGGSLLIIIISVVTGLLCCCGGYFFWRRRRNRLADCESKVSTGVGRIWCNVRLKRVSDYCSLRPFRTPRKAITILNREEMSERERARKKENGEEMNPTPMFRTPRRSQGK